jgi:hypothetical protein
MRYQLRHIRAQRTRSSPGAKHDDSRRERAHTNFLARSRRRHRAPRSRACAEFGVPADRASLPPRSPLGAVPWLSGRASASHAEGRWFDPSRDHPQESPVQGVLTLGEYVPIRPNTWRLSAVYPQSGLASESIECIRDAVEVRVVEVGVCVCGDHDGCVAHRHLQQLHVGTRRSRQRRVGVP